MSVPDRGAGLPPVRPARTVEIVYERSVDGWVATSPQLRRLRYEAATLPEVRSLVMDRLNDWLDPAVRVVNSVLPADNLTPEELAQIRELTRLA